MVDTEPVAEKNDKIILGINVLGLGQRPAAWQSPGLQPLSFVDAEYWQNVGRVAEQGTLDAIFLADSPALGGDPKLRPGGALEPSSLLASVASATSHIGLIGTASTTLNDPFELAQRFQTLDVLSGGRAGWNAVTSRGGANAEIFGIDSGSYPTRDIRYARAHEFVRLVEALWHSTVTGQQVVHHGRFFDLEGSLAGPPSPQGTPVIVQAGGSPGGRQLAGEKANGVFTAELTLSAAQLHYREVKHHAVASGRNPHEVKILPGFALVIGSTEEEAARRYDELESRAPSSYTLDRLSGILGVDAGQFELDQPLPEDIGIVPEDPIGFKASLSFRETTVRFARENNLTVRQILREYGGYGHPIIIGTPERIAATLIEWFRSEAADGFNLMPDVFPEGLQAVVDEVVPILRREGVFRHEYEDHTVRGRFYGARTIATAQPLERIAG